MPALDDCSPQVVRALEKAGWTVSAKPKRHELDERVTYIDLVARHEEKLTYIEVKCFPPTSANSQEEYGAVGQYIICRTMLVMVKDSASLYLAVPHIIYEEFDVVMRRVIQENHIKLLVVDMESEEIVEWIE